MKRIVLIATASSMLALGAPGMAAAAHHGKHHHGAHHANAHKRHAARAHLVSFGAASLPTSPGASKDTGPATRTTPSTDTAGTVTSFEKGVLTITLNDGSKVSGQVTADTQIECESATPPPTTTDEDDQGSGDDQSGSGSGEQGGLSEHSQRQDVQQGDGQGDEGDDEGNEGERRSCTETALIEKTVVRKAELRLSGTGAVWEKIDLITP
jgi:hypothetical protein